MTSKTSGEAKQGYFESVLNYFSADTVKNGKKIIHNIETLDHDTSEPLKDALKCVETLITYHSQDRYRENDKNLFYQTIQALKVITSSEYPERIFTKVVLKKGENFEAKILSKCETLIELLEKYNRPGLHKPSHEEIGTQLEIVHGILKTEQKNQQGLVPKILSSVFKQLEEKVQTFMEKSSHAARDRHSIATKHPLIKLLDILGNYKYCSEFPAERQSILSNALRNLENNGTLYVGVLQHVQDKGGLNQDDMTVIFTIINDFILAKLNTDHSARDAVKDQTGEAKWKALAKYEGLRSIYSDIEKLKKASDEGSSVRALSSQFELLISILEKQSLLVGEEGGNTLKTLSETIYGWLGLALKEIREASPTNINYIVKKFHEVKRLHKNEKYLESIRLAQRLIEDSIGEKLWDPKEIASPLSSLQLLLNDFNSVSAPRSPPKSEEVRKEFKRITDQPNQMPVNEAWDKAWDGVIQGKRHELVTNICEISAFKISMQYILGKSSDERDRIYKKVDESLVKIAGENGNYDGDNFEDRIKTALVIITNRPHLDIPQASVDKITGALNMIRNIHYSGNREKRELHKTLYFCLLKEVIDSDANISSLSKMAGNLVLNVIYKILELFIQPFSEALLERFKEYMIDSSNGTLTEVHLAPIKALGCSLGSYSTAKKAWPDLKNRQVNGKDMPHEKRILVGKTTKVAMERILDNSLYYHGYEPMELDREAGYVAVDRFLNVVDFMKCSEEWHSTINRRAKAPLIKDPETRLQVFVNSFGILIKRILSLLPHTIVGSIRFCLKILELLINFLAQQLAKFAIWKWDIISNLITDITDSLFKGSYNSPVIDELSLDQLKLLDRKILHDSDEEGGGISNNEFSLRKKDLREFFAKFIETVDIVNKDTTQEVSNAGSNLLTAPIKLQIKNILKEHLSSLFLASSELILEKKQMNDLLLTILTSATEGMRGTASSNDDEKQARKIHGEKQIQIRKHLSNIRRNGVNPLVSRIINQIFTSSSDMLLDYIEWLERRLFSSDQDPKRNIILMLKNDLKGFARKTEEEQDVLLRKIEEEYTTFLQGFIAKQSNMDDHEQITNSLKINSFIGNAVKPKVKKLTDKLTSFIEIKEGRIAKIPEIQRLLKDFEQPKLREKLMIIKEAEKLNIKDRQSGIQGKVQTLADMCRDGARNIITPYAQQLINKLVKRQTKNSRELFQQPDLLRHILRYQLLNFVRA